MSVLQNQDFWWGEGDDMFFIDGETTPSIVGTGSEDYFLGAWDFGDRAFSYGLFGAPVKGEERAGSRSSFTGSISTRRFRSRSRCGRRSSTATPITDPTTSSPLRIGTRRAARRVPAAPAVDLRLPRLYPVGGPGSTVK